MAEHLTRNEDVGGSTPPGGSTFQSFAYLECDSFVTQKKVLPFESSTYFFDTTY